MNRPPKYYGALYMQKRHIFNNVCEAETLLKMFVKLYNLYAQDLEPPAALFL